MKYSIADIAVALDSVSQICDRGATVIFKRTGGHILTADNRVFLSNALKMSMSEVSGSLLILRFWRSTMLLVVEAPAVACRYRTITWEEL